MKKRKFVTYKIYFLLLAVLIFAMPFVSVYAEGIYYNGEQPSTVSIEENFTSEDTDEELKLAATTLSYRVKQDGKWTAYKKKGSTAAKVETAVSITNLDVAISSDFTGTVRFRSYTKSGWSAYTTTQNTSVTKGELQAVSMKLTGELAEQYDIYYRIHMTDGEWLDWASNGGKAGSTDLNQRMNAIDIKLVVKGQNAPGSTEKPYVTQPDIAYRAVMAGEQLSDSADKAWGKTAGSKQNKTAITGIAMQLSHMQIPGGIEYRVAAVGGKFGSWVSEGNLAGREKSNKGLSRIQIRLKGQFSKAYDIYYRVKIKRYGWLGWAKNGKTAGSKGLGLPITAYQVKLVEKGTKCSLNTNDAYLISDKQEYVIKVNKKMNCVTVYLHDKPIKAFVCSTGEITPVGTFYTKARYRWRPLVHEVWGQYCTRIVGRILFHSVPYHERNNKTLCTGDYRKLGKTASAGCVRLTCKDAKWIYDNCKLKTKVVIYNSNNPGPLGKPEAPYLPAGQKWDPTDPAFSK